MLEHFINHGNDYVDVYRSIQKREMYPNDSNSKYREFTHWQPVNEWQIEIQVGNNEFQVQ